MEHIEQTMNSQVTQQPPSKFWLLIKIAITFVLIAKFTTTLKRIIFIRSDEMPSDILIPTVLIVVILVAVFLLWTPKRFR